MEGLIILDDEGPLLLQESDLQILNGINGAKIIMSHRSTVIVRNHIAESLTVRAVQFEMQSQ